MSLPQCQLHSVIVTHFIIVILILSRYVYFLRTNTLLLFPENNEFAKELEWKSRLIFSSSRNYFLFVKINSTEDNRKQ